MKEEQRDTVFLTQIISYDDSAERRDLARRILRAQAEERCVRRAICLMILFTALAAAGICYAAVFLLDPVNIRPFLDHILIKVCAALALGSLISLARFMALGNRCRGELARHREECRCLTVKIMESRFGKPIPATIPLEPVSDAAISEAPLRTAGATV